MAPSWARQGGGRPRSTAARAGEPWAPLRGGFGAQASGTAASWPPAGRQSPPCVLGMRLHLRPRPGRTLCFPTRHSHLLPQHGLWRVSHPGIPETSMHRHSHICLQPGAHTWIPSAEQASSPVPPGASRMPSPAWGDPAPPGQGASPGVPGSPIAAPPTHSEAGSAHSGLCPDRSPRGDGGSL